MNFVATCVMAALMCAIMGGSALAAEGKKTQNVPRKAPLYKIRKPDHMSTYGTYYPLCQEVLKIVNLPENNDFRRAPLIKDFSGGGAFYIPLDRFKNFSLPTWEVIPKEEWTNYVDPDLITKWERPNGPIVQMRKIMVDIDHDGNKDEMIDFSSDIRVDDPNFQNPQRACVISKNAAPYMLDEGKGFAGRYIDQIDNCFIFSYRGRAYVGDGPGSFHIKEFGYTENVSGRRTSETYVCDLERKRN